MKGSTLAGIAYGFATITNTAGLHARPSVKLTQLAKGFECKVEVSTAKEGPWTDAKSPVKLMRVKAPRGVVLHVRCVGPAAEDAVNAVLALMRDGFGESVDEAPGVLHG